MQPHISTHIISCKLTPFHPSTIQNKQQFSYQTTRARFLDWKQRVASAKNNARLSILRDIWKTWQQRSNLYRMRRQAILWSVKLLLRRSVLVPALRRISRYQQIKASTIKHQTIHSLVLGKKSMLVRMLVRWKRVVRSSKMELETAMWGAAKVHHLKKIFGQWKKNVCTFFFFFFSPRIGATLVELPIQHATRIS